MSAVGTQVRSFRFGGSVAQPIAPPEVYTHCPKSHADQLPCEFGERWRYEAFNLGIGEEKEITAFWALMGKQKGELEKEEVFWENSLNEMAQFKKHS